VRSAINPLFTPKRMAALDDKVRAYARTTIAAFRDRGDCELMHEFARPDRQASDKPDR
jgi:cytochrome P450